MNYYSTKETAKLLDVSERWIQMCCKKGNIYGAKRMNEQGAWMVPEAWVMAEKNKSKIGTVHLKEGNKMKNIVFVFDEITESFGKELLSKIEQNTNEDFRVGIIPIYSNSTEEELICSVKEIVGNTNNVIGITSSGNGMAIFANKLSSIIAAPVTSLDDVEEAISTFHANAFDISASNPNCIEVCLNIIERLNNDEMES